MIFSQYKCQLHVAEKEWKHMTNCMSYKWSFRKPVWTQCEHRTSGFRASLTGPSFLFERKIKKKDNVTKGEDFSDYSLLHAQQWTRAGTPAGDSPCSAQRYCPTAARFHTKARLVPGAHGPGHRLLSLASDPSLQNGHHLVTKQDYGASTALMWNTPNQQDQGTQMFSGTFFQDRYAYIILTYTTPLLVCFYCLPWCPSKQASKDPRKPEGKDLTPGGCCAASGPPWLLQLAVGRRCRGGKQLRAGEQKNTRNGQGPAQQPWRATAAIKTRY